MPATTRRRRRRGVLAGGPPVDLYTDDFDRPNSNTEIGVANNGETWQVANSVWGIHNGRAYQPSQTGVGESMAWLECNSANGKVSLTHIPVGRPASIRVLGRVTDDENYIMANGGTGGIILQKVVAGTPTTLKVDAVPFPQGGRLTLYMVEDQLGVFVNDVLRFWVTETDHQNVTAHGMGANFALISVEYRYENFNFEPVVLDTLVTSMTFLPASLSINKNQTQNFVIRAYNAEGIQVTGKTVTVVSDDPLIVSSDLASGDTPLTVQLTGEEEGGPIDVTASVDGVSVSTAVTILPPTISFTDDFTRANSTTTAGVAPNGNPWVAEESVWGISSNQLYQVSQVGGAGNEPVLLLETSRSNFYFKMQWTAHTQGLHLVGRAIDKNNFILAVATPGGIILYKVVNDIPTVIGNPGGLALALNDYIGLRMDGDQVTVVKNDIDLFTVTESAFQTETKVGIRMPISGQASLNRYDNATFTELTATAPTATTVEIQGGDVTDFLVDEQVIRTAIVKDQYGVEMPGEPVTWSSEDEPTFTVDPDTGELTAVAPGGPFNLIASSGAATPGTVAVTVSARVETTLILTPSTVDLGPGETVQLVPTVLDQHDNIMDSPTAVVYDEDTPAAATVDAAGLVTAVAEGLCTVSGTSGAAVGFCTVNVYTYSIAIDNGATANIRVGDRLHLAWQITNETLSIPVSATPAFVSDEETEATVDTAGIVDAIAEGAPTITASYKGATAQIVVTIDPPLTWLRQLDISLGGDGTGTELGVVHLAKEYIQDSAGEVVVANEAFGLVAPMTVTGVCGVDPIEETLVTPEGTTTPHVDLETAPLAEIDASGALTLVCWGISSPVNNSFFRFRLRNAANSATIQILRGFVGTVGADEIAGRAGQTGAFTDVVSGVDNSASMRVMIFRKDAGTNLAFWVPDAAVVFDTLAAPLPSEAYKIGWYSENPTAPGQPNKTLAGSMVIPRYISDGECEIVAAAIETEYDQVSRAPAPTGSVVDNILLTPNTSLVLTLGNDYQVNGVVRDSSNNVLPNEGINYSGNDDTNALVSTLGVVTPVSTGTLTLTATSASDPTKTATLSITIVAPADTSVRITPKTATVFETQSVDFNAVVLDQATADGVSIGFPTATVPSFSSLVPATATVDSGTGLALGVAAGTVTIRATAGAFTDDATLQVVVPGASGLTNEPAGFIKLVDRPFITVHPKYGTGIAGGIPQYPNPADLHLAEGWSNTEGKHAGFNSVNFTGLQGDGKVLEAKYPPLMRSGVGPFTGTYIVPAGRTEVYVEFWIWVSPNWVANNSNTNKAFFFGLNQGNNQLIVSIHGRNCGRLAPRITFQGIQEINFRSDFDPSFLFQNREIRRGVWTKLSTRVLMHSTPQIGATPASDDGEIDFWVDGLQQQTFRNMHLAQVAHPTRTPAFSELNCNPTYGGGGEGIPKNYVNALSTNGVMTYSRQYVYDQSVLPPSQRSNISGQEQGYPTPSPYFAIDSNDEAQYFRYDRVYISYNP